MLGILRTLLPLLGSVALLLVWAVVILVVVVRWVISQFQAEKTAIAVVTLLLFLLLPVGAGLLGHVFWRQEPVHKEPAGAAAALSELMDKVIEGSPGQEEEQAPEPDGGEGQDLPDGAQS